VTSDAVLRTVAVAAGVAIALAPLGPQIVRWAKTAFAAIQDHAGLVVRLAVAAACIVLGTGLVRLPAMPSAAPVSWPAVDAPSDAMKSLVSPVRDVMQAAPMGDRLLWSQLWSKAAIVVAGDAVSTEVVFTDTRSLRLFTVIALEIGWRRIGGNEPGKLAGLREATEAAFAGVLGTDVVPVTKDMRSRYADLCRALAWAALPPQG
jgi:hypothetical protein